MMCKLCKEFYERHPLRQGNPPGSTGHSEHYEWHDMGHGHRSDAIRCAFTKGIFDSDSWSCQTMLRLRQLAGEYDDTYVPSTMDETLHHYSRDDNSAGSFGMLYIPDSAIEEVQQGYLVMSWYKSRGHTGQAWVMHDTNTPVPLTLITAEALVAYFEKEEKK